MKFEIPYNNRHKYRYWLCGLYVVLGMLNFLLFIKEYFNGASKLDWISHLLLGLFLLAVGLWYLFDLYRNPRASNIVFEEEGIIYHKKGKRHLLKWNDIKDVQLGSHSLTVYLKSNQPEKLGVSLRYKERQTVNKKLRKITEDKKIHYSSKY